MILSTTPDDYPAVPTTPEEITPKWLTFVLDRPVASVAITMIIPGTATKVPVRVLYDSADHDGRSSAGTSSPVEDLPPQNLCIKGGLDPSLIRALPFVTTIYRREVDFYTRIAPLLSDRMRLPGVYWPRPSPCVDFVPSAAAAVTGVAAEGSQSQTPQTTEKAQTQQNHQGIFVMADPSANPSITFGHPATAWSLATLGSGLERLAALNASTWGWGTSSSSASSSSLPQGISQEISHYESAILRLMQTYGQGIGGADRLPGIPAYVKDQARMARVLRKHFDNKTDRFRCLVHGDAHVSNTWLVSSGPPPLSSEGDSDENPQARFLDWQMIHLGSCFHDVVYLIVGALDIETRREKEMEAVGLYLQRLEEYGGSRLNLAEEEVLREYNRGMLAGVGPIMCPYEMQPREWVWPMAARYAAALEHHGVLELVGGLWGSN